MSSFGRDLESARGADPTADDPSRPAPGVAFEPAADVASEPAAGIAPEDLGRANLYALLSRLFADAPDAGLLEAIAASPRMVGAEGANELALAWSEVVSAAASTDAATVAQEYTDLFVGVGKSEVNLHASHYVSGFMMEKPLAALRSRLAELGLARQPRQSMVEDHLASLCETMRALVVGQGALPARSLAEQQVFFEQEIEPWFEECCNALSSSPLASFYRRVGQFARCFLRLEQEAFRIG